VLLESVLSVLVSSAELLLESVSSQERLREACRSSLAEDWSLHDESLEELLEDESLDDESLDDESLDDESLDDESLDDESLDDESAATLRDVEPSPPPA
jgi:DNA polymerase III subunit gamma/tau